MIMHYTTTNESFLKLYYLLREMGIENNSFFLELHDESLLEVDPFNISLTEDQKLRIINECTINPYYFIRECVRIPASGISKFEIHRGNLALIWCILNNLDVYTILPRQMYKTFTVAAVLCWVMFFGGQRTEMMLYANSDQNLKNNMSRIRAIRDYLPEYLQFTDSRCDRDSDDGMFFTTLGNSIKKKAPGRSVEAAVSVGRGFSTPIQWYDEFAFIPNIYHQYTASVFGYMEIARKAEKNKLPHSRILTTTAGYLNTDEGKYAFKFLNSCLDFSDSMYDMNKEDLKETIKNNSNNGFLRVEYMYYDLGRDETYFEEQRKAVDYDSDAIDREVLNRWKDVSKEHPLGQELVALLDCNIRDPKKVLVVKDVYFLKFYRDIEEIEWDIPYVIGMDCSGNVGKDFTTMTVVDPRNFEVVATMRTNIYSTIKFAKAVLYVLNTLFINAVLVPERNSMGIAVIDSMCEEDYGITQRIYTPTSDPTPGMKQDKKSRELIYNVLLKQSCTEQYNKIYDRTIINEIHTLTRGRNGRIDHMPGEHDDMLMSYLIARWFIVYGEMVERYVPAIMIGSMLDIQDNKRKKKVRVGMKDAMFEERTSVNGVLFGNSKGTVNSQSLGRTSKYRGNPLINQFEQDGAEEKEDSISKINMFLKNQEMENRDENIKVVQDEEAEKIVKQEEQNYDKNPAEMRYNTQGVSVEQELDRKLSSSDIDDFKFSLKGIF